MVTLTKYGAKYNRNILFLEGLSTDTKPTDKFDGLSIQNGSEYTEVDTGKKFLFDYDNATWYEVQTGGGGSGFTPTTEQLAAMNSGITAEDVTQIGINQNNISSVQNVLSQTYNSADCNMSVYLYQDNGAIDNSTYYIADQSEMHFKIRQFRRLLRYWKDGVEYQKYYWSSMGLIATNNSAKKNMLTLDIPEVTNETYVKIQPMTDDDDMQTNIGFVWQKGSVNVGDVWYIRPHIEYTDLETGMEYTMYGDVYKVTAGVPCTIECDTLSCTELTQIVGDINSVLEEVL